MWEHTSPGFFVGKLDVTMILDKTFNSYQRDCFLILHKQILGGSSISDILSKTYGKAR